MQSSNNKHTFHVDQGQKIIYLIPGLGADHRIFKYLNLNHAKTQVIQWVEPTTEDTIATYAQKLKNQIPDPEPILIGMSLGGVIAIEISKLCLHSEVIIISSFKGRQELPFYYQWIGSLPILQSLNKSIILRWVNLLNWFFGTNALKDKNLLEKFIIDTDEHFLKWAIQALLDWKQDSKNSKVLHIHGDKDRILPLFFLRPNHIIKNGGHFMIISHAKEISKIIVDKLKF